MECRGETGSGDLKLKDGLIGMRRAFSNKNGKTHKTQRSGWAPGKTPWGEAEKKSLTGALSREKRKGKPGTGAWRGFKGTI